MPCWDDCCVDESPEINLSGEKMADDRCSKDDKMMEHRDDGECQCDGLRAMRSVESFEMFSEDIDCSHREEDSFRRNRSPIPSDMSEKVRTTDLEILRGITMRQSLRGFGSLWHKNPKELDVQHRAALFNKSWPVEHVDIFISHTWSCKGWSKVLSLLMQSGCDLALVCWFLGMLMAFLLWLTDVLPMPLRYLAQTTTFTASCPMGVWIVVFGLLGTIMGLLLSPYRPGDQGDVCFIDVACIHQTDVELMHRGIRSIGGFLLAARELRILWSSTYLTRLWCVFELATYKRLNPHGKIVLAPLFLEKIVGLFYLGNVCAAFFYLLLRGSGAGAHIVLPGIVLCCLPYILTIHNLRGYYVQKHQLVSQFQYFDLESVECAEENDRLFVNTAIAELYGSNEALTSFVRGPLLRELLDPLCRTAIPQKYILFIITPMTSLVLEFLLSLWTAGAPLDVLLLYFFSVGVVGICANWQVLVYLVNLLCDHLAEPVSKRTPAFEPWALHQFLGVHMSKCAN